MDLPRIDAHTVDVAAPPPEVWRALTGWISHGSSKRGRTAFSHALGCDPTEVSGEPGTKGSTFPGFRVAGSEPPRRLALQGGHRFSDYTLDFDIEDRGGDGSLLRATTHAAFPGIKGQLYKTAVIRSRAHVVATRSILQAVARRAEGGRLDQ